MILGEMAEWSIASDLKSEELEMVPWVRIPLSLLNTCNLYEKYN